MRVLVQRVSKARVVVSGEVVGAIERGLLVFVGITASDTEAELQWMATKCANLRIFADEEGLMNRSLVDVKGNALVVSQFTLYGDARKGNRPSFVDAAKPEIAEPLYQRFCALMSDLIGRPVATGRFAAMMDVELTNDGPVTIWIEREAEGVER
jgi:D-tyrosyl-tRNA(Tyr) deacylase